jgi:hypothetical protein
MGSRGTAGIRGWCGCREVDGSMDSRRVAVLLLLLLMDWGHAEGPGVQDEDPIFVVSEHLAPTSPFPLPQLGLVLYG